MAIVIAFEDVIRARRRREERACAQRCVDIIESALHVALDMFESAPPPERWLYARRVRHLSDLLAYAVRTV